MTGLRALVEAVREARAAKAASKQIFRPGLVAAVRDAEAELATAITPDVLAAVEAHPDAMEALAAVRRLGEARASSRAAWAVHADEKNGRSLAVACDAQKLMTDAHEALGQLADRLAARKGK